MSKFHNIFKQDYTWGAKAPPSPDPRSPRPTPLTATLSSKYPILSRFCLPSWQYLQEFYSLLQIHIGVRFHPIPHYLFLEIQALVFRL